MRRKPILDGDAARRAHTGCPGRAGHARQTGRARQSPSYSRRPTSPFRSRPTQTIPADIAYQLDVPVGEEVAQPGQQRESLTLDDSPTSHIPDTVLVQAGGDRSPSGS